MQNILILMLPWYQTLAEIGSDIRSPAKTQAKGCSAARKLHSRNMPCQQRAPAGSSRPPCSRTARWECFHTPCGQEDGSSDCCRLTKKSPKHNSTQMRGEG